MASYPGYGVSHRRSGHSWSQLYCRFLHSCGQCGLIRFIGFGWSSPTCWAGSTPALFSVLCSSSLSYRQGLSCDYVETQCGENGIRLKLAIVKNPNRQKPRILRDRINVWFTERPVGIHARTEEVLACPYNDPVSSTRRLASTGPRFCRCPLYLHIILASLRTQ